MNRPLSYLQAPRRMQELWPWVCAVEAFDWGDRTPLTELIKAEAIPAEFVAAVADIIAGKRIPRKGAARAKIPASERMKVAGSLSAVLGLCEVLRLDAISPTMEQVAEREGKEVGDMVSKLHGEHRKAVAMAAEEFQVSIETIENLLRDMRDRINSWPAV